MIAARRGVTVAAALLLGSACAAEPTRERRLDGAWVVELALDSAAPTAGPAAASRARADAVISERLPDFPSWAEEVDRDRPYAVGRFAGDLRSVLGDTSQPARVSPRLGHPSAEGAGYELLARMGTADSVIIDVAPRVADAGLMLRGRLQADAIRGHWRQRSYCCGQAGTFTMWKVPGDAVLDSTIAIARRESTRR
jgi:hypothetical protein